ncbi:hypothetical protein [Pseudomonas entomophila]|uniref:Uncharacterized protein n=2 Tax=Pseudomonas entomophila TaxID=312306 RepID=Q1IB99_PSEE4|nr:hypothetical protein [Pseudomonas entomophila]WMW04153.1 hypothetical protein RAH46_17670 [Pseudomonas entomophila]CAK15067.1 hypothetical protein PSEEN2251 [Pseudomonas entomophila L48]
MENYDTSALGLQKCLLNMRKDHAQLKATGDLKRADELARIIARLEQGLLETSQAFKPTTLQ